MKCKLRACASTGRGTHQDGPESARGVAAEVSQARFNGRGGSTGLRFDQANCCGARTWQGVARPRACISFVSAQPGCEPDHAVAQGDQLKSSVAGVSASAKKVLGSALLGTRISGCQFGNDHR